MFSPLTPAEDRTSVIADWADRSALPNEQETACAQLFISPFWLQPVVSTCPVVDFCFLFVFRSELFGGELVFQNLVQVFFDVVCCEQVFFIFVVVIGTSDNGGSDTVIVIVVDDVSIDIVFVDDSELTLFEFVLFQLVRSQIVGVDLDFAALRSMPAAPHERLTPAHPGGKK